MDDERKLLEGLKPCPFCGRHGTISRRERMSGSGMPLYAVRCYRCGAEGPMVYGYEDDPLAMEAAASFRNGRANDESGN